MDRAVVYATDTGFLVPSLVSALEVKAQIGSMADVVLVIAGVDDQQWGRLQDMAQDIGLIFVRSPDLDLPRDIHFNATHVPPSALLRFKLPELLDAKYRHIIYLDGDTRVTGEVVELVSHSVAQGKILAANDNPWLGFHIRRKWLLDYLSGLGIDRRSDYFNSGVFAIARDTMDEMFPLALDYFLENSKACRYHDQSALNAVFKGRREVMSPRFNFISDYSQLDLQDAFAPCIIHFTGGTKPWHYTGRPWNGRFMDAYKRIVARYPNLSEYFQFDDAEVDEAGQEAYKKRRRFYTLFFPIYLLRRRRFAAYMKQGKFSV